MKASRRGFIAGAALLPVAGMAKARQAHAVRSPDGKVTAELIATGGALCWTVAYAGTSVVEPSPLALLLASGKRLGPGARLIDVQRRTISGEWTPPYGVAERYTEACEELTATFAQKAQGFRFAIVLRAYDAGVAIRYRLLDAPDGRVTLAGEETCFRLPAAAQVIASRDEGEYQNVPQTRLAPAPHPDLTPSCDAGDLADTPVTVALPGGATALLAESDRLHYPRLMLRSAGGGLTSHLMRFPGRATGYSGPGDTPAEPQFSVETPFDTPWRVVAVAGSPAALIETQPLIPTLASPNRLGDVDWIRPGRAFRIRKPYTNDNAWGCIAFAARRKLDYVEFDAHWYGDGTDPSDATRSIAGLDMPAIIARAKEHGLGVILYVDRVPAMRQLDDIVRTYAAWGVAGIKFGFVWEGRQSDNDFIYELVRKCGEHRLLVNLHDNLRPAGLERTLPNYVALEGVRGNEQFPSATHNVTLPFTRALAGPIDYTICYAHPRNRTTNAHQLAMAAVYYNPLTFLYWYDRPAKYMLRDWPDLAFLDECPTAWHETRAISGAIGEHVIVARRNGRRWFVGAMTNEQGRTLRLPLDFLGQGRWRVRRFADGAPVAEAWQTPVVLSEELATAADTLDLVLAPSGGQALIIEPV